MIHVESTFPASRRRLAAVLNEAGDVVRIDDARSALDISRNEAAKQLSRWMKQGWFRRVGRGVYLPVPIEMLGSSLVLEDPWILVPSLFDPAYVGGRSAAEHWDLTEQIFNDIVVLTGRPVREKSKRLQGIRFSLKHIKEGEIFGTTVHLARQEQDPGLRYSSYHGRYSGRSGPGRRNPARFRLPVELSHQQ